MLISASLWPDQKQFWCNIHCRPSGGHHYLKILTCPSSCTPPRHQPALTTSLATLSFKSPTSSAWWLCGPSPAGLQQTPPLASLSTSKWRSLLTCHPWMISPWSSSGIEDSGSSSGEEDSVPACFSFPPTSRGNGHVIGQDRLFKVQKTLDKADGGQWSWWIPLHSHNLNSYKLAKL